ncbi:DUF6314 family protein [Pseudarthrobacter sp. PH31-O2]|uniref:DUF6314 family protein n=1 Tax=Pseudarthrobacter sp. PH31-O2 TaxID=3046206 RepID=UPI0024BAE252|nr:DUF6314 family protein [Pseudarthrobacter sp. PH31-O2]MDJ0353286.1 DUF6314 family protein [Pseudarthrobacter sp. PH31-O2]
MNPPSLRQAPCFDLRAYLLGSWTVERSLLDRSNGTRGTFTGVVSFKGSGDGGGLRFREEGTAVWASAGHGPFSGKASREYLLRRTGTPDTMDMFFPDGRPFHRMGFGPQTSRDQHWCDPDRYRVSYSKGGPDDFSYQWDVTGPAKDQRLVSVLRRIPGSAS